MAALTILAALRARWNATVLAVLGAFGFFTRLPIGTDEASWTAVTERPATMILVAYPIGATLAVPLVLDLPAATVALAFPVLLLASTGITHLDGLADVGDAAVVHGDAARRREVLLDTEVGVGAIAAVGVVLLGLALAGFELATAPLAAALAIPIAAEVGAKLGMVAMAGFAPVHFGTLGSQFDDVGAVGTAFGVVLAVPAVLGPALVLGASSAVTVAALLAVLTGPLTALAVGAWATTRLDGVNGDCFGATNEVARVAGLHLALIALAAGSSIQPDVATVLGPLGCESLELGCESLALGCESLALGCESLALGCESLGVHWPVGRETIASVGRVGTTTAFDVVTTERLP